MFVISGSGLFNNNGEWDPEKSFDEFLNWCSIGERPFKSNTAIKKWLRTRGKKYMHVCVNYHHMHK